MDKYKVVNGTSYHTETPNALVSVLEIARLNRTRIRIYLGDTTTGADWAEENDIMGYVGRSRGTVKIPLLIHNSKSIGGGGMLDHCILKVKESKGGRVLYQHPKYTPPTIEIVKGDIEGYSHNLNLNGELYSRHKDETDAIRLKNKLS